MCVGEVTLLGVLIAMELHDFNIRQSSRMYILTDYLGLDKTSPLFNIYPSTFDIIQINNYTYY